MENKILLICFLFVSSIFYGQTQKVSWLNMGDVKFEETYVENYGDYFLTPEFGSNVKKLQGKKIQIKGYVLDLIGDGQTFLLSKQPMASCFFCGMAGPETIMEIQFNEKQNLETDQIITVQGELILNKDDVNHCNYILKNPKIIEE